MELLKNITVNKQFFFCSPLQMTLIILYFCAPLRGFCCTFCYFRMTNVELILDYVQNGVRGLMLDTYDFNNDVWLCHSFGQKCYNITAFQPAINAFKEIQTFLDANPSEVITIFLEDYTATGSLPKVFNASGLMKYWFPVAKMPKSGGNWPLLKDMISQNQRLL